MKDVTGDPEQPSDSTGRARGDALAIWKAGVNAVRSDLLIQQQVACTAGTLWLADRAYDLNDWDRLVVVGAGKAGAGMAAGFESALGSDLLQSLKVDGWINVPEDCVRKLSRIHLHGARPAGVNEPTEAGVAGTEEILTRVRALGPRDLCVCLISGGGSALLPAPTAPITLHEKQQLTRFLSGAGANIRELNTVRKAISNVKGGGLARACRAGGLVTMIISDVLGDPLDLIASGPTVPSNTTAADALQVLDRFDPDRQKVSASVFAVLESSHTDVDSPALRPADWHHLRIVANNATAVDSAGIEAESRGYSHAMNCATDMEGEAEAVGRHLAEMALKMRRNAGPDCLITGGEPIVHLPPSENRGRGGRNQQLVLAALQYLRDHATEDELQGICLLSGGTDGEDGPTDAAGAWIDGNTLSKVRESGLDIEQALQRCDAYTFFDQLEQLIHTGPTHTNVCDVRVVVVRK